MAMRITRATTYIVGNPWKNWLFVRLDTDQPGLYGVGEGSLNAFAKTVEAAIHELAPRYEGMDPFQIETIYQRMTRDVYSEGAQIHMNAVAAIDRLTGPDWYAIFRDLHAGMILDLAGNQKEAGKRFEHAYSLDSTALRVVQAYGSWLSRNRSPKEKCFPS